jgi:hypothetical protein
MELSGASGFVKLFGLAADFSRACAVAGDWSSLRSSLTFTRRRAGLRGLPERARSLVLLLSPSETLSCLVPPPCGGSSPGIRAFPFIGQPFACPLPAGIAVPAFGLSAPPVEVMFHLRGFSPPWRLAPSEGRGFVAPRNRSWGSLRFSPRSADVHAHLAMLASSDSALASPQRRHPSEFSLRRQPHRVTAAVAFLPLPCAPARSVGSRFPTRGSSCVIRLLRLTPPRTVSVAQSAVHHRGGGRAPALPLSPQPASTRSLRSLFHTGKPARSSSLRSSGCPRTSHHLPPPSWRRTVRLSVSDAASLAAAARTSSDTSYLTTAPELRLLAGAAPASVHRSGLHRCSFLRETIAASDAPWCRSVANLLSQLALPPTEAGETLTASA